MVKFYLYFLFPKMASQEKHFSTLTSDLGNHYRIQMAKRLTSSKPTHAGSMSFTQLKVMSKKDSVDTLSRLLGLRREEIFRHEQEEALALVGFRKKSKASKFADKHREDLAVKRAETYLRKKRREQAQSVGPRWYDPDARMDANTPGPAGYDLSRTSGIGKGKIKGGGGSWGVSKTTRGGFLGNSYREAVKKAQRQREREAELVLEEARWRQQQESNKKNSYGGGSAVLASDVRQHEERRLELETLRSGGGASSLGLAQGSSNRFGAGGHVGADSVRRGYQKSAMGKRNYMVSSGPRTTPANWIKAIEAAPTRSEDRWSSPGPRYNVRQKLVSNIPGKTIGIGAKFSKSSRPSMVRKTSGPGPAYQPKYSVVDKNRPNTTMCPRRAVGSIAPGSDGPGPVYYPVYDNKGSMGASTAYSFADFESRGGDKTRKVPKVGGPVRDPRGSMRRRARSSGALRGRQNKKFGNSSSRGGGGLAAIKPGARRVPMDREEAKALFAEASIHEMRKGIWHKIRGRGDGAARNDVLEKALANA
jgi:hypothetical protein